MTSCKRHVLSHAGILAVFLAMIVPALAWAIDALPFKDRAEELRFQHLTRQLRCLVCQNESLADSSADLAKDLRREVFEQMQQGKDDDAIRQYLTDRYSDFVLYDPPLRGATILLWFGPLLVFLIGATAVARIVRKRAAIRHNTTPGKGTEEDW